VNAASHELDLAAGTATQLGGIFFLIPFLRSLGIPGILGSEFGILQPPSGWALLELVARSLLPRDLQDSSQDPVWAALCLLDGRGEHEPPASDFIGCDNYRLPAVWLRIPHVQADPRVTLQFRERRLLFRHTIGFPLLDRFLEDSTASDEVAKELAMISRKCASVMSVVPLRRRTRQRAFCLATPTPDACGANRELRRFLQFIVPYLRWRLSDAMVGGGADRKSFVLDLIRRQGRLYVSSTHVDLVMDLEQASMPVRLAGLDANPGWVPELGRVITFHYR